MSNYCSDTTCYIETDHTHDGWTFNETEVNELKAKISSLEAKLKIAKEALNFIGMYGYNGSSSELVQGLAKKFMNKAYETLSKLNEEEK